MHIDARNLDSKELLSRLKDYLASKHGGEVDLEVIVNSGPEFKKAKSFAAMSGCRTEVIKKDGYYIMHITGSPCCT